MTLITSPIECLLLYKHMGTSIIYIISPKRQKRAHYITSSHLGDLEKLYLLKGSMNWKRVGNRWSMFQCYLHEEMHGIAIFILFSSRIKSNFCVWAGRCYSNGTAALRCYVLWFFYNCLRPFLFWLKRLPVLWDIFTCFVHFWPSSSKHLFKFKIFYFSFCIFVLLI